MKTKPKYYVLVSWGWIEPTEFTVVDAEADEVVENHTAVQTSMNEWKELALKLNDKYFRPIFNCESSEPDRNKILEEAGIHVRTHKSDIIEKQRDEVMGVQIEKGRDFKAFKNTRTEVKGTIDEKVNDFLETLLDVRRESLIERGYEYIPVVFLTGESFEHIYSEIIQPISPMISILSNGSGFMMFGVAVIVVPLNQPNVEEIVRGIDAWAIYTDFYDHPKMDVIKKRLRSYQNNRKSTLKEVK